MVNGEPKSRKYRKKLPAKWKEKEAEDEIFDN